MNYINKHRTMYNTILLFICPCLILMNIFVSFLIETNSGLITVGACIYSICFGILLMETTLKKNN